MSLRTAQEVFAKNTISLYQFILSQDFTFTYGEVYRTDVQAWINSQPTDSTLVCHVANKTITVQYPLPVGGVGILKSKHRDRLAVDINIFKDGSLVDGKEILQPLGNYWETLDPLNRWGGNFKGFYDPYHFESNFS